MSNYRTRGNQAIVKPRSIVCEGLWVYTKTTALFTDYSPTAGGRQLNNGLESVLVWERVCLGHCTWFSWGLSCWIPFFIKTNKPHGQVCMTRGGARPDCVLYIYVCILFEKTSLIKHCHFLTHIPWLLKDGMVGVRYTSGQIAATKWLTEKQADSEADRRMHKYTRAWGKTVLTWGLVPPQPPSPGFSTTYI